MGSRLKDCGQIRVEIFLDLTLGFQPAFYLAFERDEATISRRCFFMLHAGDVARVFVLAGVVANGTSKQPSNHQTAMGQLEAESWPVPTCQDRSCPDANCPESMSI